MQADRLPLRLSPTSLLLGAAFVVLAGAGIFLFLDLINVVVTVFLAIVFAEAIRPPVRRLQQLNVPRPAAVLAIYLLILGILAGSLALVSPPLIEQVRALVRQAPSYGEELRSLLPDFQETLADLGLAPSLQRAFAAIDTAALLRGAAGLPAQIIAGGVGVLGGFALAAFWLGLTETVDRDIVARLPTRRAALIHGLATDLSSCWGGWLRGQLFRMLFVGVVSFVALVLLRVPFPVPLAVWTAVTKIFPIVGPWVGGAPAVVLATLISPALGAGVFVLYVAIHQVENYFVVPKVMQHAMGLHPFVVLTAILIGSKLLGIAGLIVALPVAAGIQVLLTHLWLPRIVEVPPPA